MDPHFERYLELCKRIYERMEREGSWPWDQTSEDSQDSEEMVESKNNPHDI